MTLEDVQSRPDLRGVALDEVGISGLRYPVLISDGPGAKQESIGEFAFAVALPSEVKGTHMSRFVEILHECASEISATGVQAVHREVLRRLTTPWAKVAVDTEFFRERLAPVSGARALLGHRVRWSVVGGDHDSAVRIQVTVPVTSVCPCSKAISDYGAHNQRGQIIIGVLLAEQADNSEQLTLINLFDLAESAASAPVYPLLKRPDERFVTMQAYDNPVFVEDMARTVAEQLRTDDRVLAFRVHAANEESIHDHAAYAVTEWPHRGAYTLETT
ncbi:GTP cyclohydrolase FolE2 [Lentzea sp. NPDC058436]|uniref:GTP cyclohydrolase FolE2 n=1 Tax=Lentzea sp. NPDC058436 TaxID=3346499 RepID=UPI003646E25F